MDHDEDGILERMVKFDAMAVRDIIEVGTVLLTINGELVNGMGFEGTDVIRVIDQGMKK